MQFSHTYSVFLSHSLPLHFDLEIKFHNVQYARTGRLFYLNICFIILLIDLSLLYHPSV